MARTSRRQKMPKASAVVKLSTKELQEEKKIPTALYARLSVEQDDNDTIQNQIAFLQEYLNMHSELQLYDIYQDNGFSGTTFDRPDFQRMMMDIQTGRVQCVIVKDLSRFGRNFVETGYYIETLLPKLNVRLISINDRYDSTRESSKTDISVPVKNMVNDLYAKDISKKICASNEARRKSGNYTIEKSIYGYSIDKEANEFVVNPETAPVVQLIFHWFLEGMKCADIAKHLNTFDIMTPNEYKYMHEFKIIRDKKEYWNSCKVRAVLKQNAYSGDRCLGMRRNRLYQNQHKQEWLPKEYWTIYQNDHEPLVTRSDFNKAQEIIAAEKAEYHAARERIAAVNTEREGMFTSLIYCKKCGRVMHHHFSHYPNGEIKPEAGLYACRGRGGIDAERGCGLTVRDGYLQAVVAGQIQFLIKSVLDLDNAAQVVVKNRVKGSQLQKLRNSYSNLRWKIEEYDNKILKLYEDLTTGVLEQEDYMELRVRYQEARDKLLAEREAIAEKILKSEESIKRVHDFADNLRQHADNLGLTKELVEYLIERIDIDGNLNIEITFKCDDVFREATGLIKAGDEK